MQVLVIFPLAKTADVMEHTNNLYGSIARYFGVLETVGHYDRHDVKKLLIYLFIVEEIFNGQLQQYLDDDGLQVLNNVLRCISKSTCFAISPDHVKLQLPVDNLYKDRFRISEAGVQRITNTGYLRKTENNYV